MQATAFTWVLKLPEAQAPHCLSVVALPLPETCWPEMQSVQGTHAVALLPSSSHVPLAHVVFGAVPPGQTVPASQGVHCG